MLLSNPFAVPLFSACRDQTHFHHRAGAEVAELVDDGKVEGEDDDADKKRKKKYSHASLTDNFCKLILDIIYEWNHNNHNSASYDLSEGREFES